jgi:hypothetical protein
MIRDTLNSCSLIPIRNRKHKRISEYYRSKIAQSFDKEKYPQRNTLETVFSVMKRKSGESLKARKYRFEIKEINIQVILCNLSRLILTISFLILIEEFYRAERRSLYNKILKIIMDNLRNFLSTQICSFHQLYSWNLEFSIT